MTTSLLLTLGCLAAVRADGKYWWMGSAEGAFGDSQASNYPQQDIAAVNNFQGKFFLMITNEQSYE